MVDSSYFIQKFFTVLLNKAGFLIIINFEIVYNNQNKCIFSIRNFKDLCIKCLQLRNQYFYDDNIHANERKYLGISIALLNQYYYYIGLQD